MAYIYKIEVGDCLYIGSTNDIKQRQRAHNYRLRNGRDCPIYTYCRENGVNKLELIELEYVDIEDRFIVEQYYIDEFKTGHKLLNCRNTTYDKKTYMKEYHEANKDKRKAYRKAYKEANKAYDKVYMKEYHEANKDKIKARRKAYREANKDKIKAYMKAYYEEKTKTT